LTRFFQDPPQITNRFRTDPALRDTIERLVPRDAFEDAQVMLDRFGARAAAELAPLADQAERHEPEHTAFDSWGRRVDRVDVDASWLRLVAIGQEEGLVALPYEAPYGPWSRIIQAGMVNLYDPVSAMATCPLVMTDGAARLLSEHDPELAARYVPKLTARQGGWTSGQWMTEAAGGSDVGQSETTARPLGDGRYALNGLKWFTSATTSQMALVLARPEGAAPGSRGLSLFLVELKKPDGSWNGIEVRRLKDKLGTRALPTAELELKDMIGVPVGGIGRGVGKMGGLLNIARLWSSWSGPAGTGHLLALARDYAGRRRVFGSTLAEKPIHLGWIARIAAEYEAMLALTFHTAGVMGAAEHGDNTGLARLLAPLTKLASARQGVWATSELLESFGGAGYVEDTGIPRILRNVHVNCIWEGTTSVLAHDVLRVLTTTDLGGALVEDMQRRLADLRAPALDPVRQAIGRGFATLSPLLAEPTEADGRRLAWGLARCVQATLQAEAADWRIAAKGDGSALTAAMLITREPLVQPATGDLGGDALGHLAMGTADRRHDERAA
jgi:alkylation response protein AidB-like acyl-CoA dehydrogenase